MIRPEATETQAANMQPKLYIILPKQTTAHMHMQWLQRLHGKAVKEPNTE